MTATPSNDLYIQILTEKFLAARNDAEVALELLKSARRREEVYGETLKAEGVKLPSSGMNGHRIGTVFTLSGEISGTPAEKPLSPLSGNHALHLIMKAHGNVGFTFEELKQYSDDADYGLTDKDIRNIWWRQLQKGLMEKTPDGKIRLTKKGETFNRFRIQKMA